MNNLEVNRPIIKFGAAFLIGVLFTFLLVFLYHSINSSSQINIPTTGSLTLISQIPPSISFVHYEKIISIINYSYNYNKTIYQNLTGTIDRSNISMVPTYENLTLNNIKFGRYIIIIKEIFIYPKLNFTSNFTSSYLTKYIIYIGNGTIINV